MNRAAQPKVRSVAKGCPKQMGGMSLVAGSKQEPARHTAEAEDCGSDVAGESHSWMGGLSLPDPTD